MISCHAWKLVTVHLKNVMTKWRSLHLSGLKIPSYVLTPTRLTGLPLATAHNDGKVGKVTSFVSRPVQCMVGGHAWESCCMLSCQPCPQEFPQELG